VTFNIDFLMFPPLLEWCQRHSAFGLWICGHILRFVHTISYKLLVWISPNVQLKMQFGTCSELD